MDAIPYFIVNSFLSHGIVALIAFLLGLWFGWCLYGGSRTVATNEAAPATDEKSPTSDAKDAAAAPDATATTSPESSAITESSVAPELADYVTATEAAEAEAVFEAELQSGAATLDEQLGIIYKDAPAETDDLTKIKGVAAVLNGRLNDFGVYHYRQIATWTPEVIAEFSKRLAFKKRIAREDWVGQAKAFHKEKYGEDL